MTEQDKLSDLFEGRSGLEVYEPGTAIYRPGDKSERLYILRQGLIHIERSASVADHHQRLEATIEPGWCFGAITMISQAPRIDFAQAVNSVTVTPIDSHLLDEISGAFPAFPFAIMNFGIRYFRSTTTCLDAFGPLPTEDLAPPPRRANAARMLTAPQDTDFRSFPPILRPPRRRRR